jgi:hypothetical protein
MTDSCVPLTFGPVARSDSHPRARDLEENHQMLPTQTLHDFVLNLLTDPDARSAFDLDPESALHAAGLTDVTAADVQDVVPLVVDSVPVHEATTLAAMGQSLPVDGLVDSTDAVSQLQLITQQLGVTAPSAHMDVNTGILGTLAVDPTGVTSGASVLSGLAGGLDPAGLSGLAGGLNPAGLVGLDGGLSAVHDVAGTLDVADTGYAAGDALGTGSVTDPAIATVGGTVDGLGGTVNGLLAPDGGLADPGFAVGAVSSTLHTTTGLVDSTGLGNTLGVHDTLGGLGLGTGAVPHVGAVTDHAQDTLGGLTGTVHSATSGLHGATSGLTGTVHGVTGGLTGGTSADAEAHTEAHASVHGLLGITDGLL